MELVKRKDVVAKPLPGRMIQLVAGGAGAVSPSNVITMGFCSLFWRERAYDASPPR